MGEIIFMKPLIIGDLTAKIPIIQGGMGIGISLSGLASAVSNEGGIGVISAAQPGFLDENFLDNPLLANLRALKNHLQIAKEKCGGGIIGVNIMVASKNYAEYVKCCVDNKADLIISGAGLPINLPELVKDSKINIAPIVSSLKAVKIILNMWKKRYDRTPDLVVVEGPKAGGHLGFKPEQLEQNESFDNELISILDWVEEFGSSNNKKIPVVFGGGIYDKEDVKHFMSLGADGVQIASRFVATEECDAHINFKNAYINAKEEDVCIVKSPVGMPGRAIRNSFIKDAEADKKPIRRCYSCLHACSPKTAPYCISDALIAAATGKLNDALIFCGGSVGKINEITTVAKLIKELT